MSNGLSIKKWLKGAHVRGVQEGSPAAIHRREWVEMGGNVLELVSDVLEGQL